MVLASQECISCKIQANYVNLSPLRLVSRVASVMEDRQAAQGNTESFESWYKDKAPISNRIADLWYLLGYLERQIPDLPHDRFRCVSPRSECSRCRAAVSSAFRAQNIQQRSVPPLQCSAL